MPEKLFKPLGWWSLVGISSSLTNSWLGIASSLVVGLTNGSPTLIIYGLIIAMFFALMSSIAISDFSSVLPNASGPCFWTLKLLSEPLQREHSQNSETITSTSKEGFEIQENELSFETEEVQLGWYCDTRNVLLKQEWKKNLGLTAGFLNYAGAIFTTSSVCSSLSLSILGVYAIMNPQYTLRHWHAFITYEVLSIFIALVGCNGKWIPFLSKFGLVVSILSYAMTLFVSIISRSFKHDAQWPNAKTVFGDFNNTTGWPPAMAFIVGLINPCFGFSGIDSATHMVDDTGYHASRKLVPRVLVCNVLLGFVTSFTYSIVMFYCVTDINSVVNSVLPTVQIYYQATGNKSLSAFMQSSCIVTGLFCGFSSSTWQNRVLWSISRTYLHLFRFKICGSKLNVLNKLSTISSPFDIPLYTHIVSHLLVLFIGCIFMGSDMAFNAIISACISILYLSYAIPCAILVFYNGRNNFMQNVIQEQRSLGITPKIMHGGFFALIPHIVAICWAAFCFIMFAFPYTLPVTGGNINYVCVVYGIVAALILVTLKI